MFGMVRQKLYKKFNISYILHTFFSLHILLHFKYNGKAIEKLIYYMEYWAKQQRLFKGNNLCFSQTK